jgi:hypothetical protein
MVQKNKEQQKRHHKGTDCQNSSIYAISIFVFLSGFALLGVSLIRLLRAR